MAKNMRQTKNVEDKSKEQIKIFKQRIIFIQGLIATFVLLFIAYLFANQVLDIRKYRIKAQNQRRSSSLVLRGDIYDRNGIKLAGDTIFYDIFARRADYVHTPEELAKILAPILKISQMNLTEKLKRKEPIISLKKQVDKQTYNQIAKLRLREIPMDPKNIRVYPQGTLASHVLGYYNADAGISAGVEYTAKEKLEHIENKVLVERTPKGNIIYDLNTNPIEALKPQKGANVTLTIDTAIQHICEKELNKAISKHNALRGSVIVMNPKNGEILAYAVYPFFDPNKFKDATFLQTKNWTLTDVFPPGSTFKVITVASAMETGKINKFTKVNDTGKIKVGWWTIENYDYKKHPNPGLIDLVYLFEHSSNVGSVLVAQKMSPQEFYDMLRKFGFGEKTGIDLPGESIGLLKAPNKWDSSDIATMSYGYGTSVTAIQMASAMATIANNGVRVTPHVIKYSPEEAAIKIRKTQVMSAENAKTVTELLTKSVNHGHTLLKEGNYNIAAKTGTSRKPKENSGGYTNKLYTSAIGYLPASDPQVLIYVIVDSAQGYEIWGNTVAVPIFREIANQVTRILNLTPDKK